MKDTILYDKLDISPTLSIDEIKKEGKKLLLKWHPDKNENKEESSKKFIEVKEILEILTDPEKRELYHNIGIDILSNSNNSNNTQSNYNNNEFFKNFNSQFFNVFNTFRTFNTFNSPFMNPTSFTPNYMISDINDIRHVITLEKENIKDEEVFNINYKIKSFCKNCDGKGFFQENLMSNNSNIFFMSNCTVCSGKKYEEQDKKIVITIKKEKLIEIINNKNTLIIKNNGNIFKNKITDLIVIFQYKKE